jgi:hypothetical protein
MARVYQFVSGRETHSGDAYCAVLRIPPMVLVCQETQTQLGVRIKRPALQGRSIHVNSSRTVWLESNVLVSRGCCPVDSVLGCLLGIAKRFLALALYFLDCAFALQPVRSDSFADALVGFADGLVCGSFDLVGGRTHSRTPLR